jgi:hypothetical protein
VLSNVVFSSIFPVRKPLPSGAERDEPDAQLLERGQHLCFGLSPPERVLALQRRDRLDGMRPADCFDTDLGEAEVLHLPS